MIKLFIEYIGPSTNRMYAGQHWSVRTKNKSDAIMAVIAALGGKKIKFDGAVSVDVEPVLAKGRRAYDVSNYSYTYKLVEDSLVAQGVLKNDTPEFVTSVRFLSPVRGEKTGINLTIVGL